MSNNPEMTADEQAKRRAERKAAQLKAMDRSTGYWCERDTDGIPFMHYPDGSREYWPPPKDPTKSSAGRAHGESLEYAVCPMTGQTHNAADTEWWREHYGRLADEALNAAEEYQLDQHDPDWRGKKGGVLHSNKAVSSKVPEPQRSFLTYAVETQHGFAHQLKWARVLLATGYKWRGMVGGQMQTVFEAAEREGAMDYEGCLEFYERHGRNKRWTKAKDWFEAHGATPRDLQAEERARHAERPGSPEWRIAQYAPGGPLHVDLATLPAWGNDEATEYFESKGHKVFNWNTVQGERRVWLDFVKDDAGNDVQSYGASPIVARCSNSEVVWGHQLTTSDGPDVVIPENTIPTSVAEALAAGDWPLVAKLAQNLAGGCDDED